MKIFGLISLVVVLAIMAVMYIGGVFDSVVMSEGPAGPYNLVYRENLGAYEGIKFIMSDVYKYLKYKHRISALKGFGIFYDDPRTAPKDSLHAIAGCIVDTALSVEPPYQFAVFKKTDAVIGQFPIRSFFSYTMGVFKFYPALKKYAVENGIKLTGPVMELYDMPAKKIFYIAPINSLVSPAPVPPGDNK